MSKNADDKNPNAPDEHHSEQVRKTLDKWQLVSPCIPPSTGANPSALEGSSSGAAADLKAYLASRGAKR